MVVVVTSLFLHCLNSWCKNSDPITTPVLWVTLARIRWCDSGLVVSLLEETEGLDCGTINSSPVLSPWRNPWDPMESRGAKWHCWSSNYFSTGEMWVRTWGQWGINVLHYLNMTLSNINTTSAHWKTESGLVWLHSLDFPCKLMQVQLILNRSLNLIPDKKQNCNQQFLPQDHCDFLALRNLVLAHHMEDLKETTHKIHYERFRFDKLREMMGAGSQAYKVNTEQQSPLSPGKIFQHFLFRAKPRATSMRSTRDLSETLRGRNWKLDGRIPSWPTSSTRASIPYLVARGRKFETSSLISTLNRFLFIVLLYHL